MADVVYTIAEHDGGWAYKLDGVFSETFPNRGMAEAAAAHVAEEQRVPGETEAISWQDDSGVWHDELESGSNRPNATVERHPLDERRETPRTRPARAFHDVEPARDPVPLLAFVLIAAVGFLIAMTLGRPTRRS